MIPPAVERTLWLTVGIAAAVWCGLSLVALVGMSIVELVASDSVDSSGPPSALVITPWVVGLFFIARWSLRRSDKLLPAVGARPTVRAGALWGFEDWMERHPLWRGVLVVALGLCWASLLVDVLFAALAGVLVAAAYVVTRLRR